MTDAERRLRRLLRMRQAYGFKFRRQFPIGRYVLDFVCLEARLVVEVDGGQHAAETSGDVVRDRWLEGQGLRVLRFWNSEVLREGEAVRDAIAAALMKAALHPHPNLPPSRGKGLNMRSAFLPES